MSTILDFVFIDTSVFVSENFLEGARIREIFRLAQEKHIKIILPIITYNEILSRIDINTRESLKDYNSLRNKTKILRNIPDYEKRFEKLDIEQCIEKIQTLFIEKIELANSYIIPYSKIDISNIFEKYFSNNNPFNQGNKKCEFPDAFALEFLELWSKKNSQQCIIIAGDNDILKYKSNYFIIYESVNDYLDKIIRRIVVKSKQQKRIDIVTPLYERKKHDFKKQIEEWVEDQLSYENVYKVDSDYEIDYVEVLSAEIILEDFQLISINDHEMQLYSEFQIDFEANIESYDPNTKWRDEETNEIHYVDTKEEIVTGFKKMPITFKVDFPLAGDEYIEISILEINDGKDLEIME